MQNDLDAMGVSKESINFQYFLCSDENFKWTFNLYFFNLSLFNYACLYLTINYLKTMFWIYAFVHWHSALVLVRTFVFFVYRLFFEFFG